MKNFKVSGSYVIAIVVGLGLFLYHYKRSRKFRKAVVGTIAGLIALKIIISDPLVAQAREYNPSHPSRPAHERMLPRSSNNDNGGDNNGGGNNGSDDGSGGGGKGGGSFPKTNSVESVQDQYNSLQELKARFVDSDSDDSDSDSDDSDLESDCLDSDSDCLDSDSGTKSSIFAEGFSINPPYRRPGESTTGFFSQNQAANDAKTNTKTNTKTNKKFEVIYRIKENPALVREAEKMGKDQRVQREVNDLIERLASENDNPGMGNKRIKGLRNVSEVRGKNGGRVYFRRTDGKIEILGKSNKDNQDKVLGILKKMNY